MAHPNRDQRSFRQPEPPRNYPAQPPPLPPQRPAPIQSPPAPERSSQAVSPQAPPVPHRAPAYPKKLPVPDANAPRCQLGGPIKTVRRSEVQNFTVLSEYTDNGYRRIDHYFEFDPMTGKTGQEIRFDDEY